MTQDQFVTVLQAVGVTVLFVFALLTIEYLRWKSKGKQAVITNSFRAAVKEEPWVFIIIAILFGFMAGHCFGQ